MEPLTNSSKDEKGNYKKDDLSQENKKKSDLIKEVKQILRDTKKE